VAKADRSSSRTSQVEENARISREIAKLTLLGGPAIRQLAARQIGVHAEGQNIDLLRLQLSYQLQVDAYGGLKPETKRRLRRIYNRLKLDAAYAPKPRYGLAVGTVLEREWQGVIHKVAVTDDGFEYRSMRLSTLSKVARQITGTRWSGPLFFGLRQGGPK
jgi:hypothetical protein